MIFLVLSLIILTLLLLGFVESYFHNLSVGNIPHRIHVNGTRGKSSVVRLIAAGLREGGMKVFAKTTGSCPRVIDHNGIDHEIVRLRSASIGEQIKNGDKLRVDFSTGKIENLTSEVTMDAEPLPLALREIIELGGSIPALKKRLTEGKSENLYENKHPFNKPASRKP